MSGCYGNSAEDRYHAGLLYQHLDAPELPDPSDLAELKFEELGKPLVRWPERLEIQDAIDDMTFGEFAATAAALKEKDPLLAGEVLTEALKRVCLKNAQWEIENN